jgi:preprotein translocase subunit SecE
VAKFNPGKFFGEVRTEAGKIVWPTQKQTVQSAIMVVIMTTMLAVFFFGTDSAFHAIVKSLLGLLS